ncbi:acyl-CoA dehydrogenase family protein [Knoellia aerolata]|uniref:Acyl-CoA dehydrogenase n=1 Tax=Knoellia aerolata DSM 18566 TaxID=1385519 RepID=A0A0A0JXQ4_9MICO|nr:acyl-CoA dehydrogenase family protein [Knoellia aerolata]KGN41948.1 acyl-CoA dehydrogenase [Knoellia aerolata DSM 18566]
MTDVSQSDLDDLRGSLRAVLERDSSETSVRATMGSESGVDRALWQSLVSGFDLPSLAVPEPCGGAGAGWSVQRIALEELGRSLSCVPALSVIGLGLPALVASADDAAVEEIVPRVLDGRTVVTAALLGADPVGDCQLSASRSKGGWRLSGTVTHVLDGQIADVVLVLARHDGGLGLFALDPRAAGVVVDPRRTSDQTRRVVGLMVDEAPARLLGAPDGGEAIAQAVRPQALLALACEQTGGTSAVLDQSVTYAKQRVQFGRPIGSFQAVKHQLADVLVSVEECRSAIWAAARALDTEHPDVQLLTHATAAVTGPAYVAAASRNVQVHGGIGYTWEHPAHLHVKRSRGSGLLFGSPAEHRARVTELLPLLAEDSLPTTDAVPARTTEGALP